MKNVTLALDEKTVHEARRIALERSTSLNAMIREFLQDLTQRESEVADARQRIAELCAESRAEVGARKWTRDELHGR